MVDLFRIAVDPSGLFSFVVNVYVMIIVAGLLIVLSFVVPWLRDIIFRQQHEINEVEIGVGPSKVKIRPNHDDLQIAYRLWVELKTRKLGLPFEEDHDVISEVYGSWYEFFKITRELIKSVPVQKVRGNKSTQELVGISIDVLNKSIRPHLTKWQARYRHWLEVELRQPGGTEIPPQELQKRFPHYAQLVTELKKTNAQLIAYARLLASIIELTPHATREEL